MQITSLTRLSFWGHFVESGRAPWVGGIRSPSRDLSRGW